MGSSALQYRPEIDGLRALAVAPVILFHAGLGPFDGGFVGVDVFFVISGYLITSIILGEMAAGSFSLTGFYERRARRILPALLLVVAACIPFAYLWMLPSDLEDFFRSVAAVATFSSNIHFWLESGYFDASSEVKPLLHTWSLAVEEQYYILFPLLLLGLRKLRERAAVPILAAIFLLSLAASDWGARAEPSAAFYLLPSRAWELLVGVFVALYLHKHGLPRLRVLSGVASIIGVFLIALSVFALEPRTPFPGLFALLPTLGTALVILFATERTLVRKLLSSKALVGLGLISYSAYLWHQPLLAFARYRFFELEPWALWVIVAATLALAAATWKFVELPFRNRDRIATRMIFRGSAAALVAMISIGFAGTAIETSPGRESARVLSYEPDNRALRMRSWRPLRELSGDEDYGVAGSPFDEELWFDPADDRKRMLLVGNSYSKDLWNVLSHSDGVSEAFQVARFGTQIRDILKDRRLFDSPNYVESDLVVVVSKFDRQDIASLESVVEAFLEHGKEVVLVKAVFLFPTFKGGIANLADKVVQEEAGESPRDGTGLARRANRLHYRYYRQAEDLRAANGDNAIIEEIAAAHPAVRAVDRMDYICSDEARRCYSLNASLNKYFYDSRHHSLIGAQFFGSRVDKVGWLAGILERERAAN